MNTLRKVRAPRYSKLSTVRQTHSSADPQNLSLFLAGLSRLPPDEMRKAKLLYIKNAVSEYNALVTRVQGFTGAQKWFAFIPFFRPILAAQRSTAAAAVKLAADRIENAIDVWREDLRGERFMIGEREIVA